MIMQRNKALFMEIKVLLVLPVTWLLKLFRVKVIHRALIIGHLEFACMNSYVVRYRIKMKKTIHIKFMNKLQNKL